MFRVSDSPRLASPSTHPSNAQGEVQFNPPNKSPHLEKSRRPSTSAETESGLCVRVSAVENRGSPRCFFFFGNNFLVQINTEGKWESKEWNLVRRCSASRREPSGWRSLRAAKEKSAERSRARFTRTDYFQPCGRWTRSGQKESLPLSVYFEEFIVHFTSATHTDVWLFLLFCGFPLSL